MAFFDKAPPWLMARQDGKTYSLSVWTTFSAVAVTEQYFSEWECERLPIPSTAVRIINTVKSLQTVPITLTASAAIKKPKTMKTIPMKVWNRIEMLQQPIATIACSSASNRKRWVAIHYDVNRHSIAAKPPHLYCVIDTEFDVELLEKYADFGDEDLAIVNETVFYVVDITALYALLLTLEVDPESFDAPWHVEHPLL